MANDGFAAQQLAFGRSRVSDGPHRNPKTAPKQAGFPDGASSERGALLVGKTLA